LGPGAFAEISGEVVNIALFTLRNAPPSSEHRMTAFRLIGPREPREKSKLLLASLAPGSSRVTFRLCQRDFLHIPESPLVYWLPDRIFDLLKSPQRLRSIAHAGEGLCTRDERRFVRYFWEVSDHAGTGWVPYSKGGGFSRWFGLLDRVVDYRDKGDAIIQHIKERYPYLNGNTGILVKDTEFYFKPGLTYSDLGRGSLGVRILPAGSIFSDTGPGIFPNSDQELKALAGLLNCRVNSFILRTVCTALRLPYRYVIELPLPHGLSVYKEPLSALASLAIDLSRVMKMAKPVSRYFLACEEDRGVNLTTRLCSEWLRRARLAALRHSAEGALDILATQKIYNLDADALEAILDETGTPAGWYPLIVGYDAIPELPPSLPHIPKELLDYLSTHERISPSSEELARIKNRLRALYIAGPGAKVEDVLENENRGVSEKEEDNEEEVVALGARIPIPAETFLEELSQKMEIHPVSIYWLLEEMRREEGLVCPPELKRHTEDYFTVKLLRMLGHRWPMQDQYEKEQGKPFINPKWVDRDGIIPLTPGTGEETLIERFRRFLDEEFGPEHGREVEIEAGKILGWKPGDEWGKQKPSPLERWFEREFFKRHVSQFKRRPIAWHLKSPKGTFQVIVYYHKFDKNCLQLLRARYVREVLESLRRQLAEAKAEGTDRKTLARVADLEAKIADVEEFDRRLQRLLEGRDREARIWCPWKSPEEQPVGWDPDINDGVRVNIAPVQRLGLLAAPVLSKKDLNSLLAPEGRD